MTVEASLLAWIGDRGRRCSVGEVAAGTGLSLQEVEPGLLALVAEVSGRLQVAEDGTMLFVLPAALRMRLLALSGRRRLQARLIRLSFGLVLVLVTTLVVVILLVLLIVRLFTSDDGDDVGVALLQGLAQVPLSILFGDGDPNRRLEPQRWRRIAAFLRKRGGVVIAEDLAPLLDLPDCPSDPDRRPEVSEDGDLIYGFPSLPARAAGVDGPVPPLRERAFRFSRAGAAPRVRQRPRPAGSDHRRPGPRAPADRLNPSTLATAAGSRRFARRGAAWSGCPQAVPKGPLPN